MRARIIIAAAALAALLALASLSARAEPPPDCGVGEAHLLEPIDSNLGLSLYQCGIDTWVISLELMTSHDEYGHPVWEVLDSVEVRDLGESDEFVLTACARDDIPDPDIVAIGVRATPELVDNVYRAWFVDRSVGRLWPTRPDGITCVSIQDHCGITGDMEEEMTEE